MAAVTRNDLNSGVLQTYLNRKVLAQLEPELYFYKMGKVGAQTGYNTIGWAKFDGIASSAVTAGTVSNDGLTPDDTAFNAVVVTAAATQYRIVVTISDLVKELNVIDFVTGAAVSVGNALARKIDEVIQTEIMGGTNVLFGGSAAARSALGAGDNMTAVLLNKSRTLLDSKFATKVDGGYVSFAHPFVAYDLRSESGTGNWLEVNKYVTNDKILKGEIGMLNGVRVVIAPNVKKFSSTVDVYPTLVVGEGAYGVANFQEMRTYIVAATPSESDPLAQRTRIGAKVTFAAKRLQEDCMVRIETAATSIV